MADGRRRTVDGRRLTMTAIGGRWSADGTWASCASRDWSPHHGRRRRRRRRPVTAEVTPGGVGSMTASGAVRRHLSQASTGGRRGVVGRRSSAPASAGVAAGSAAAGDAAWCQRSLDARGVPVATYVTQYTRSIRHSSVKDQLDR